MATSSVGPPRKAPFVLGRGSLTDGEVDALLEGAVICAADVGLLEVNGSGAVQCMQGLLTNDIESAGDGGVLYGAILTPKGMIVSDLWVTRTDGRLWLTVPSSAGSAVKAVFAKFLPPRIAKAEEHTANTAVLRMVGPAASIVARQAGIAIPEPGDSDQIILGGTSCLVSRPSEAAFFNLQMNIDRERTGAVYTLLEEAGAVRGTPAVLELARILSGWPRHGAEIDGRTLPQEVRFDEHDGVSYTKGCYTGQETVARLHFRGHPNKWLCGLIWEEEPDIRLEQVTQDGRQVGRVTSLTTVEPLNKQIGLAIIHRKADFERTLIASNAPAAAVPLPFELEA
jgi:folate-binding protein YgfZ